MSRIRSFSISIVALIAAGFAATSAQAGQPFNFLSPETQSAPQAQFEQQAALPDPGDENGQLSPRLRRQVIDYASREAPGTVIVDTPHTYLYYVLGNGKAIRYGIGVGRKGFTWSGVKSIVRKTEWPDWYPPPQMLQRQPYLPRMMAGGPGNPLGARAMYIGGTEYRIHGTNNPATIGKHVSSGCIRMTNDNAIDLFNRVKLGAKVIVLPQTAAPIHEAKAPAKDRRAAAHAAVESTRQSAPQHASFASERESEAQMTWNAIRPAGLF